MQKTGKIINVVSAGGYESTNGYIYTFQMTIQCPDGQVVGEIGSKSQMYPKGIGEEITIETTNTAHGVRFKKINPQYAQGGSQGGQSKKSEPNWDAIAEGKCRCKVICAAIQSNQINISGEMDVDQWVQYIMLGQNKAPQQAKPEPWDNPPQPTDDIPF